MKNQTYFTLEYPRGSMRQLKKADNYLEQRVKYDTGYFDGNARSIPAIVLHGATDNDLWYVVNLRDASTNVFLQAIAVLGALDRDQAIYAALQTFGAEYPTNNFAYTSESAYFALKRFLDIEQPFYGEIGQDALNRCQAQVLKQPATWENDNITSHNGSMAVLMHDMVQSDIYGELLDPVSKYDAVDMFIGDDGVIGTYDALITSYQRLDLLQERLATAMGKAAKGDDITLTGVTRSKPFKRNGVVNVAVIYELSDGQTISVIFHNPDSTPTKLSAQDTLTSWKWLLNKRDVSIVLQPKNGENVQLNQLAIRMLKLAHQNSARFKRTIAKRLENEKTLADMVANQAELEKTEAALDAEIIDLQKQIDEKTKAVDLDLNGDKVNESNDSQPSNDPNQLPIATLTEAQKVYDSLYYTHNLLTGGTREEFFKQNYPEGISEPLATAQEFLKRRFNKAVIAREFPRRIASWIETAIQTIDRWNAGNDSNSNSEPVAVESEKHYSEQIIDALVSNHGWKKNTETSAEKEFSDVAIAGELSDGARIYVASFDEKGRYLILQSGFDEVFDMDMRTDGLNGEFSKGAAAFNDRVEEVIKGERSKIEKLLAAPVPAEPVPEPMVLPAIEPEPVIEPVTGDEMADIEPVVDADTEYLQSIINGTADLASAGDDLERIGENLNPELEDLFEQAAEAYAQYAIAQAATI